MHCSYCPLLRCVTASSVQWTDPESRERFKIRTHSQIEHATSDEICELFACTAFEWVHLATELFIPAACHSASSFSLFFLTPYSLSRSRRLFPSKFLPPRRAFQLVSYSSCSFLCPGFCSCPRPFPTASRVILPDSPVCEAFTVFDSRIWTPTREESVRHHQLERNIHLPSSSLVLSTLVASMSGTMPWAWIERPFGV